MTTVPPTSPPKRGRPRALDECKRREVCALISAGCGISEAASYVGCVPVTISREARRDPQFAEQLKRAYMTCELSPLHAIRQAANKSWRAAAWFLERTNPRRFGKRPEAELTPEQFDAFVEWAAQVIRQETRDPTLLQRLRRRLRRLSKFARDREFVANIVQQKRRRRGKLPPCPVPRLPSSPPSPAVAEQRGEPNET